MSICGLIAETLTRSSPNASIVGIKLTWGYDLSCVCIFPIRKLTNSQADEWELYEHKTDPPETLDRKSALAILDFALLMASKKKIQQLPRAEIRDSLAELVKVIGLPKKQREEEP